MQVEVLRCCNRNNVDSGVTQVYNYQPSPPLFAHRGRNTCMQGGKKSFVHGGGSRKGRGPVPQAGNRPALNCTLTVFRLNCPQCTVNRWRNRTLIFPCDVYSIYMNILEKCNDIPIDNYKKNGVDTQLMMKLWHCSPNVRSSCAVCSPMCARGVRWHEEKWNWDAPCVQHSHQVSSSSPRPRGKIKKVVDHMLSYILLTCAFRRRKGKNRVLTAFVVLSQSNYFFCSLHATSRVAPQVCLQPNFSSPLKTVRLRRKTGLWAGGHLFVTARFVGSILHACVRGEDRLLVWATMCAGGPVYFRAGADPIWSRAERWFGSHGRLWLDDDTRPLPEDAAG